MATTECSLEEITNRCEAIYDSLKTGQDVCQDISFQGLRSSTVNWPPWVLGVNVLKEVAEENNILKLSHQLSISESQDEASESSGCFWDLNNNFQQSSCEIESSSTNSLVNEHSSKDVQAQNTDTNALESRSREQSDAVASNHHHHSVGNVWDVNSVLLFKNNSDFKVSSPKCGQKNTSETRPEPDVTDVPESLKAQCSTQAHTDPVCFAAESKTVPGNVSDNSVATKLNKTQVVKNIKSLVPIVSCKFCRKSFSRIDVFESHLCCVSVKEAKGCHEHLIVYKCLLCNITFYNVDHLQKHLLVHMKKKCNLCSIGFWTEASLRLHIKGIHNVRNLLKCKFCEEVFQESVLQDHLQQHKNVTDSEEELCDISAMEHEKELSGFSGLFCKTCNKHFKHSIHYKQHQMGHERHKCLLCGLSFPSKKYFYQHQHITHGVRSENPRRHICDICKKVFQRPVHLAVHRRIHTGEKPVQCVECRKSFPSQNALSKHLVCSSHLKQANAGNVVKSFRCECGAEFSHQQTLVRHIVQLHGRSESLKCPHCEYTSKYESNLKRHIELHNNLKRFVCELCGASFHASAGLSEHKAYVHSEKRNFSCEQCSKSFKAKNALKRHMRHHSDARPFKCHCEQSYKRLSHLKRHMASAHKMVLETKKLKKLDLVSVSQSASESIPVSLGDSVHLTDFSSLLSSSDEHCDDPLSDLFGGGQTSGMTSVLSKSSEVVTSSHENIPTKSATQSTLPIPHTLESSRSQAVSAFAVPQESIQSEKLQSSHVLYHGDGGDIECSAIYRIPPITGSCEASVENAASSKTHPLFPPPSMISPSVSEANREGAFSNSSDHVDSLDNSYFGLSEACSFSQMQSSDSLLTIPQYSNGDLHSSFSASNLPSKVSDQRSVLEEALSSLASIASNLMAHSGGKDQIVPLNNDMIWVPASGNVAAAESQSEKQHYFTNESCPSFDDTLGLQNMSDTFDNPLLFSSDPVISSSMAAEDPFTSHDYDGCIG